MTAHEDLIAKLRRRLDKTRDLHSEPPDRTLDDLAERDEKLRARVDAVRDALPAPPMREPESTLHKAGRQIDAIVAEALAPTPPTREPASSEEGR